MHKVGLGYDVHKLEAGRPLILAGVKIEHPFGLLGHSDADVLAHAVADAILGAAKLGDIGQHFPDTDPKFAGADSLKLLAQVAQMVRQAGFKIQDIDSVIVAQAPKMAPRRQAMRANLAKALGVPVECVGVKATTTEGTGPEGMGQTISAKAIALLSK